MKKNIFDIKVYEMLARDILQILKDFDKQYSADVKIFTNPFICQILVLKISRQTTEPQMSTCAMIPQMYNVQAQN